MWNTVLGSAVAVVLVAMLGCGNAASSPAAASSEVRASAAADALAATSACDPAFVSTRGSVIEITPTNDSTTGDTANLQCAFDAALSAGKHTTIRLARGTFHTAQLVAKGFVGALTGAGRDETIITKVDGALTVTPVDFFMAEPGPTNPYPSLIAFVNGVFAVSDLTIRILDEEPTTGWSIFGIDPPIKALAHEIVIVGTSAHAVLERVRFVGKAAPSDLLFGMNIYNAAFFEGFLPGFDPLTGAFEVRSCDFVEVAAGAVLQNVRDAHVSIVNSTATGALWAVQLVDLDRSNVRVAGNRFERGGAAAIQILDGCLGENSVCGVQDTKLVVTGNELEALDGVEVFATFNENVGCQIVGNDIDYDAENGGVAVWLGRDTRGCFVSTEGVVRDRGTNNRIVTHP